MWWKCLCCRKTCKEVCEPEKPSGSTDAHCSQAGRFGLTGEEEGDECIHEISNMPWDGLCGAFKQESVILFRAVNSISYFSQKKLANTGTEQIFISVSDFAFLFSTLWKCTKRDCLASWEDRDMHTQTTFPGPISCTLCHSWCKWKKSDLSCLLSSCVPTMENSSKRGGFHPRHWPKFTFYRCQSGGELIPACDYLGYSIYGKVTHKAMLGSSCFINKKTEILKGSIAKLHIHHLHSNYLWRAEVCRWRTKEDTLCLTTLKSGSCLSWLCRL